MKTENRLFPIGVLVLLISCSVTPPDAKMVLTHAIVGKWRQVGGARTVQFFREGTMISATEKQASTVFYKVLDHRRLEIEPKYHPGAGPRVVEVVQVSIEGEQLTLTDSKGTVRYKREP